VTLVNPTPDEIRGWSVTVTLPDRGLAIGSVHGAFYRQSGQVLTFTPADTTRSVAANDFVRFDFSLTGAGNLAGCAVDGRSCNEAPG
jgi:hypothetical protein